MADPGRAVVAGPVAAGGIEHLWRRHAGLVEFFKKGESVDNWTTTYAARLTLQPGRSLDDYRRATMYGYSQICKEEALGFFNFGEETDTFFPALGMACGAYKDNGKLRGLGEVMVAVFRKTDTGIAMVYQEWKGRAFDPSNPKTWPVDAKAFQAGEGIAGRGDVGGGGCSRKLKQTAPPIPPH